MDAIGIDISKAKFDVCCLFNDCKKRSKVFKNNISGFEEFMVWIERLDLEDPHFCMEATGCYGETLAEFLYKKDHKVSVVNPSQIKRYKESRLTRQKTDKSDASVIAMFCMQNNPLLWTPKPLEVKELSEVDKHITNLKQDLIPNPMINAPDVFCITQSFLSFVVLSSGTLIIGFGINRWKNRLEKEYGSELVHAEILRKIKELKAEIKMFEKETKRIINSSPDLKEKIERITGIVGVGDKSAIAVLTALPPIESFENAWQYATFIGVTPCHKQSGTSVNGRSKISKKGNRYS